MNMAYELASQPRPVRRRRPRAPRVGKWVYLLVSYGR